MNIPDIYGIGIYEIGSQAYTACHGCLFDHGIWVEAAPGEEYQYEHIHCWELDYCPFGQIMARREDSI